MAPALPFTYHCAIECVVHIGDDDVEDVDGDKKVQDDIIDHDLTESHEGEEEVQGAMSWLWPYLLVAFWNLVFWGLVLGLLFYCCKRPFCCCCCGAR